MASPAIGRSTLMYVLAGGDGVGGGESVQFVASCIALILNRLFNMGGFTPGTILADLSHSQNLMDLEEHSRSDG